MPHIGYFPVPAYPKPLVLPPAAFVVASSTNDYSCTDVELRNLMATDQQLFRAPVLLPQGARITKMVLRGFRDPDAGFLKIELVRTHHDGSSGPIATVVADWITGWWMGDTTDITTLVVDNNLYFYHLLLYLDPSVIATDVRLRRGEVHWQ